MVGRKVLVPDEIVLLAVALGDAQPSGDDRIGETCFAQAGEQGVNAMCYELIKRDIR